MLKFILFYFREMGREEEREGEKQQLAAFRVEPATQACALTGNQTSNLSVRGTQPTKPRWTGPVLLFLSQLPISCDFTMGI